MTDARAAANHARQRIGCSERASERATRGALPPPDTLIRKWMAHFHVSRPNTLFFRQHSNVQDCHKGQVSPLSWNGVNETRIRASHLSVRRKARPICTALHSSTTAHPACTPSRGSSQDRRHSNDSTRPARRCVHAPPQRSPSTSSQPAARRLAASALRRCMHACMHDSGRARWRHARAQSSDSGPPGRARAPGRACIYACTRDAPVAVLSPARRNA